MTGKVQIKLILNGCEYSSFQNYVEIVSLKGATTHNTGGMYYKTLRTCNVRQMDAFCSKLVSLKLLFTNRLAFAKTLAEHKIHK